MTVQYTIQSGDTLTKIAQQQYGLKGNAAYQKALEIAKANGIKNPNLIFTGNVLQLTGTKQETDKTKSAQADTFEQTGEEVDAGEEFANKYQELLEKQKLYAKYQTIKNDNKMLDRDFKMDLPKYNPKTDKSVAFADSEIFNNEASEKVAQYKDAALKLANASIKAIDKEDENGKKDGKIDFSEFAESEIKQNRETYKGIDTEFAKKAFIQAYYNNYGNIPAESIIHNAIQEDMSSIESIYAYDNAEILDGLKESFESYDFDGSGYLEQSEIATMYMAMDASNVGSTDKSIGMLGENDEILAEFDGVIDFANVLNYNAASLKKINNIFFGK